MISMSSNLSRVAFSCKAAVAVRFFSTITTEPAPRDAASKPSAPEPANMSRQVLRVIDVCSQANRVSRMRSPLGRRPETSGNCIFEPRLLPEIMRTVWRLPILTETPDVVSNTKVCSRCNLYPIQSETLICYPEAWHHTNPSNLRPLKSRNGLIQLP